VSDRMRYRYGEANVVVAAVDSGTVIEIGDLVYQDVDDAKPASAQSDQGSETANQELFADNFLGVAMEHSGKGDTDPIDVATTGVFRFDCPADTFELGDLVGVGTAVWPDAPDELANQFVSKVGLAERAIGRVAKRAGVPTTKVYVDVRSTVMTGGVKN